VELNIGTALPGHKNPISESKAGYKQLLKWGASSLLSLHPPAPSTQKTALQAIRDTPRLDASQWSALDLSLIVAAGDKEKAMMIQNTLTALADTWGSKTDIPEITQLFRIHTAFYLFGVTSSTNCKSGCDRTSLSHAVALTVAQVLGSIRPNPDIWEAVLDLLLNYKQKVDNFESGINSKNDYMHDVALCLQTQHGYDDNTLAPTLIGTLTTDNCGIIVIQQLVFQNLVEVASRVVAWNTGLFGFKFGLASSTSHSPHWKSVMPFAVLVKTTDQTGTTSKGQIQHVTKDSGKLYQTSAMKEIWSKMMNDASGFRGSTNGKPWSLYDENTPFGQFP